MDGNDLEELRPFGDQYLSLVFENPLFPEVDWGFTSDFREPTRFPAGSWPILILSSADVSEITLSWEGDLSALKGIRLRDEDNGKLIVIKADESYTFLRNENGNRLTLLVR
jgi:hypothetical protein